MRAYPSEKSFELETKNSDVGESTYSLDATLEGDDLSISFNHKYIHECFQSINSDSIVFKFAGVGKPVVISGVTDKSFTYLVMPMNK